MNNSKNGLISNVEVYGLDRTKMTCQYPMNLEPNNMSGRLYKLSKAKIGSGHDCALKGIMIRYDLDAPAYFWQQWQRYHFSDIVSSQSKMHRLTQMNIPEQCNEWVLPESVGLLEKLISQHKNNPTSNSFQTVLSNTPMGLKLKADCVSNLLQEKTKYEQRRHHKLSEWQEYCDWVETFTAKLGVRL